MLVALANFHPCVIIVDAVETLELLVKFRYPEVENTIGTVILEGPTTA